MQIGFAFVARYGVTILASLASGFLVGGTLLGFLPFRSSEVFGIITGIACVVLAIRQNIWNFPIGIISNLCFAILFYSARLYGIMGVQIIFLVLSVHGWYSWSRHKKQAPLRVSHIWPRERFLLSIVGIPVVLLLSWYLRQIGGATPFLDSLATVMSLSAQFLLNLKRIENWSIGAAVDVIYMFIYVTQGLYLTALLYAFYFIMCLLGYLEWRDALRKLIKSASELNSPEHSKASSIL